ncbi:radical SAM protein [bacterium]|nr:radical SAM protein [bacterium]RQV94425.1 MAG: radical SAM protein [bacterium]
MIDVSEIFYSIQGESSFAGLPCVFVRLSGCNLDCRYCDTRYAADQKTPMSIAEIVEQVGQYGCLLVEITGGEPLIQEETPDLIRVLSKRGFRVLLETNGTQNIDLARGNLVRIVDIKCPGSGESDKMDWENIKRLKPHDEVKFVLTDLSDYNWAKDVIKRYALSDRVHVLFSPVHGQMDPARIAEGILQDRLKVRLQLQLHKIIWPDQERGR